MKKNEQKMKKLSSVEFVEFLSIVCYLYRNICESNDILPLLQKIGFSWFSMGKQKNSFCTKELYD